MKKRIFYFIMAAVMVCSVCLTCLAACQNDADPDENTPVLVNYQGDKVDGSGALIYNKDIYRRNDWYKGAGADPFIMKDPQSEYFYMFSTCDMCAVSRSKNLTDWEEMGNSLNVWQLPTDSDRYRACYKHIWAPEAAYDAETGLYYLFFSASPQADTDVTVGQGVAAPVINVGHKDYPLGVHSMYQLYVGVSQNPEGPYEMVDFTDAASCGEENLHNYNTTAGIEVAEDAEGVVKVRDGDKYYKAAYPQFFAKYLLLDPEQYNLFADTIALPGQRSGGFVGAIDPHPYVDGNGQKYLYFVDNVGDNGIVVIKMDNWLKPDWSSAKLISVPRYYTVEDYFKAQNGDKNIQKVTYENANNKINEGPAMIEHNGLYYLTFSVNDYGKSDYSVGIAVSDKPDGDFRKLRQEEGGLFLNSGILESRTISGTGHHSLITVGEQLFVCYHRHDNYVEAGGPRHPVIDEVKWITVKDINGKNLDVMYTNGPSDTVMPLPEAFSQYKNITSKAKVTATNDVDPAALHDGLITSQKSGDEDFAKYIPETEFTKTTTFTFTFDQPKTLRALMVYNSVRETKLFRNISKIAFELEENGETVRRVIRNVKFNAEAFTDITDNEDGSIYYCISASSAHVEFDEINVKSVAITVDVPEGQESSAVSEIVLLGKDEPTKALSKTEGEYVISNPSNAAKTLKSDVDDFITLDGNLDEYKNLKWLAWTDKVTDSQYAEIKMAAMVTEKGLYVVSDVTEHGSTIYYNPDRASFINSCSTIYLAQEGKTNLDRDKGVFEIDMQAGGSLSMRVRVNDWVRVPVEELKRPVLATQIKGGAINTPESYGYTTEMFIPKAYFEYVGWDIPENFTDLQYRINPVHIFSFSYSGTHLEQDRKFTMIGTADGCGWSDITTWYKGNKDGFGYGLKVVKQGLAALGDVKERNGRDVLVLGKNTVLNVVCKNGSHLTKFEVNGVDKLSEVVWNAARDNGTFTISDPDGDVEIVCEFSR